MNSTAWEILAHSYEKALKSMVSPCNKELFHLELTAYSTTIAAAIVTAISEQMEHMPEVDSLLKQYEDEYIKILKRIEGLA